MFIYTYMHTRILLSILYMTGSVHSGAGFRVPMMKYPPSMNVTLVPMDIRTFNITVNPLNN